MAENFEGFQKQFLTKQKPKIFISGLIVKYGKEWTNHSNSCNILIQFQSYSDSEKWKYEVPVFNLNIEWQYKYFLHGV